MTPMDTEARLNTGGIGASDVDAEHEIQVRLLAAFVDAVAEKRAPAEMHEILDRLVDYSKVHFLSEELLMRLYGYEGYESHVLEHERALEQIEDLRRQWTAGDLQPSSETADQLASWIVRHINQTDRLLGHFLKEMRSGLV